MRLDITKEAIELLIAAESVLRNDFCEHECVHFSEEVFPAECDHLKTSGSGLIGCKGYEVGQCNE